MKSDYDLHVVYDIEHMLELGKGAPVSGVSSQVAPTGSRREIIWLEGSLSAEYKQRLSELEDPEIAGL